MKVTKIETFVVALPARRRHVTATRADDLGQYTIVQIHTDEGIVGLGEATPFLCPGRGERSNRRQRSPPALKLHERVLPGTTLGEF